MLIGKREKISKEQSKKLEIFATIFLIVFAIASFGISTFFNIKTKENIVVFVEDKQISEIDGEAIDITVDRVFTIGDINGEYNTIEIKNNEVRCIESNCPDQICVSHGALKKDIDNDMIVCAPHKLSISYQ